VKKCGNSFYSYNILEIDQPSYSCSFHPIKTSTLINLLLKTKNLLVILVGW